MFDWSTAAEHCRLAWLRARFLSGFAEPGAGAPTSSSWSRPRAAGAIAAHLADLGLPAGRLRRGRGVLTWKSAATGTVPPPWPAPRPRPGARITGVTRALRGDLNRLLNAESANLRRSVARGQRVSSPPSTARTEPPSSPHLPASWSDRHRGLRLARKPDSELAGQLGLSRASVQRAMERIEGGGRTTWDDAGRAPGHRRRQLEDAHDPADAGSLAPSPPRPRSHRRSRHLPAGCRSGGRRCSAPRTDVAVGAQNVHAEACGAFTGEVSAPMLVGLCDVGHRRSLGTASRPGRER